MRDTTWIFVHQRFHNQNGRTVQTHNVNWKQLCCCWSDHMISSFCFFSFISTNTVVSFLSSSRMLNPIRLVTCSFVKYLENGSFVQALPSSSPPPPHTIITVQIGAYCTAAADAYNCHPYLDAFWFLFILCRIVFCQHQFLQQPFPGCLCFLYSWMIMKEQWWCNYRYKGEL